MVSQVIFIHGGETFDSYEQYFAALAQWIFDPNKDDKKRWKHRLAGELAPIPVIAPAMPNKYNAKYREWKLWFEKVIPHAKDDVVLIGHSLGGVFLAKYLAENTFPVRIRGTFLIAAPYRDNLPEYVLADFMLPESLEQLAAQAGALHLYHSEDDPVVPFTDLAQYVEKLPSATVHTFTDRGHFMQEEFPEIIEEIRAL